MDRVNELRGAVGGSRDSSLDSSSPPSEAYITANDSSKYFSLSEVDSSFETLKESSATGTDNVTADNITLQDLDPDLTPITKNNDIDSYKIGRHIEASNILSGGENIFDDNDNSYDGNELVIDDNVSSDIQDETKSSTVTKNSETASNQDVDSIDIVTEDLAEAETANKETEVVQDAEVVLQIDGKNVNAIDIGKGLYLYRREGAEEELAAVQILDTDGQQPTIKFLKVRENAEGNLEVYEEIVEVHKEIVRAEKVEKTPVKSTSHLPIKDIKNVFHDTQVNSNIIEEKKNVKCEKKEILTLNSTMRKPGTENELDFEGNVNHRSMKIAGDARKSPLIGTFTPMTFHSTPNKGVPLTKTMVDLQLHPNRHADVAKKTIEVNTESCKQRIPETSTKAELPNTLDSDNLSEEKHGLEIDNNETSKDIELEVDLINKGKIDRGNEIQKTKNVDFVIGANLSRSDSKMKKESETCKENESEIDKNITKRIEVVSENEETDYTINTMEFEVSINREKTEGHENKAESETSKEIKLEAEKDVIRNEECEIKEKCKTSKDVEFKVDEDVTRNDKCENKDESKTNKVIEFEMNKDVTGNDKCKNKDEIKKSKDRKFEVDKNISKNNECENNDENKTSKEIESVSDKHLIKANNNVNENKVHLPSDKNFNEVTDGERKMYNKVEPDAPNEIDNIVLITELNVPKNTTNEKSKIKTKEGKGILLDDSAELLQAATMDSIDSKYTTIESSKDDKSQMCSYIMTGKEAKAIVTSFTEDNDIETICKSPITYTATQQPQVKTQLEKQVDQSTESDIVCKEDLNADSNNEIKNLDKEAEENLTKYVTTTSSESLLILPTNVQSAEVTIDNKDGYRRELGKTVDVEATKSDKNRDYIPKNESGNLDSDNDSTQKKFEDNKHLNKKISEELDSENATGQSKDLTEVTIANPIEVIDSKIPLSKPLLKHEEPKPKLNNNNAVPFGQWTEANKQEYLIKIKESKAPTVSSNTNQIKQPNDLNRRDVLKKIDSARQSSNLVLTSQKKDFTIVNKLPLKPEIIKQNKHLPKAEPIPKTQTDLHEATTSASKDDVDKRTEINNQDLIDKTIEGILMDKILQTKPIQDETIPTIINDKAKVGIKKNNPKNSNVAKPLSLLDDIEQKMNELHGIPFIERPPHKLPQRFNQDFIKSLPVPKIATLPNKGNGKSPNIVSSNTIHIPQSSKVKDPIVDEEHSEEEILESEPVTGDINLSNKQKTVSSTVVYRQKIENESVFLEGEKDYSKITNDSKDFSIITERDFDKFARRNSITCEETLKIDSKQHHNVVQTIVERPVSKYPKIHKVSLDHKTNQPLSYSHNNQGSGIFVPVSNEEAQNKNYSSKLQMAYQSALTAKRQKESPITVIEDKPVKVVFINNDFVPYKLNVQGQQLTSSNKQDNDGIEFNNLSSCDSLDSDVMDNVKVSKTQDEVKVKTKHQRKQVLTPVETPELELIEPKDLGIEVVSKLKRKTKDLSEFCCTRDEQPAYKKNTKRILPKKNYLLGRNTPTDDIPKNMPSKEQSNDDDTAKETLKQPLIRTASEFSKNDIASNTIDSLVKAAELLENQPEVAKAIVDTQTDSSDGQPLSQLVKRGRGRPRKYLTGETTINKSPSPQKKLKLRDATLSEYVSDISEINSSEDEEIIKENWTMGKINENIVCPICSKLFRSENVVFKHVKHCTGPSPSRSQSSASKSPKRRRLRSSKSDRNSESQDSDMSDIRRDNQDGKNRDTNESSREKRETKAIARDEPIQDTDVKKIKKLELRQKNINRGSSNVKKRDLQKRSQSKPALKTNDLVCEFCGKMFRQLSYLVNHKLLHQKQEPKKSVKDTQIDSKTVFSCDECHKRFRKLHHLVQHRIMHKPDGGEKMQRKRSVEQSDNKSAESKIRKDDNEQGAGFRCERCEKSFRKLHHLVEHRETHDGVNRLKNTVSQNNAEKNVVSSPQCDVCQKKFRKLHHLIEHKEQHNIDANKTEKSDNKKGTLLAKDIIHECSLCYMVFPNEHSLNKHTVICERKKRQSAAKQAKEALKKLEESSESVINETNSEETQNKGNAEVHISNDRSMDIENDLQEIGIVTVPTKRKSEVLDAGEENPSEIPAKVEIIEVLDPDETQLSKDHGKYLTKDRDIEIVGPTQAKNLKEDNREQIDASKTTFEFDNKEKAETLSKEIPVKEKTVTELTEKSQPLLPTADSVDISDDDDDVRYMLNPDFKVENEGKVFMKVRANKRNSLQIERPKSKDLIKRRISLQHPPKIPRMRPKPLELGSVAAKNKKSDKVPSLNDDNEIKYSFPKTTSSKPLKANEAKKRKDSTKAESDHTQRVSDKRKSLSGIAKKKSTGKPVVSKLKRDVLAPKKRLPEAGYRCDCGQLFGSAALLARHTTLAHTPPRVRRRRSPPPPAAPHAPQPAPQLAPQPARPSLNKSSVSKLDKSKNKDNTNIPVATARRSATRKFSDKTKVNR